jgi:glycosyltransferase involved in cell wall biosynthesis
MCIESMIKCGTPLNRVVVVDNGSTDDTRNYLETLQLGGKIYNETNLGCGVAWNQGSLAMQTEWSIIMNNDVIVSPQWVEKLITSAEEKGLKVISPAIIEGALDYDFDSLAKDASARMKNVYRLGARHAVCIAIHKSVWLENGYFQPIPKLMGYEDTIFFNDLDKSKILTAITGSAWIHHFGSITQTAIKLEKGLDGKTALTARNNYKILNKGWIERKIAKMVRSNTQKKWVSEELSKFDMTVHGLRKSWGFHWI